MAKTGRPTVRVELADDERETLTRLARRAKSSQALALRSKIVLASAEPGATDGAVAEQFDVSRQMVGKWRKRFADKRLDGLCDDPRPGRPPSITIDQIEDVVVTTLEQTPADATHWSRNSMAERTGLSATTIGLIWHRFELAPHKVDQFKISNDPFFFDKVVDIVGLYLDPPHGAIVLCVDEKSQVRALERSAPVLPMMPGMPERRTHDYIRHGVTTLFAAFDVATGEVITEVHRRHRAVEFKKFLNRIDREVPDDLDVHLICDNYSTHKTPEIKRWLARHPRFHMHYTPTYSSWINQVERWFGFLTDKLLRRSTHRNLQALERDLRAWIDNWNTNPKPLVWTKTAEEILAKLGRLCERINGERH